MDYIKQRLETEPLRIYTFYCGFCGTKEISLKHVKLCECGKICEANDEVLVEIKKENEKRTSFITAR